MRAIIAAGLMALWLSAAWSPTAEAQFEPLAFAVCKKIPSDADRLKCFDTIGKQAEDQDSSTEPNPVKDKWTFRGSKSPIDDSDQLVAMLQGEAGEALLILRCWENKSEAVFIPPDLVISGTGNRYDLLIRINGDSPASVAGLGSTNGRAIFVPNARDFMKLLPDQGKLFIRATGFQGRSSDSTFLLNDVTAARNRIAETCRWTTSKSSSMKAGK
ncbi:hypothetical protein ABIB85_004466 [Bradyrhizobium sp. JR1.5]|uniref:hypothetical protein n=1 Tax=unclassified Bradyrhizobium TaxID=2631580 RepID=UPI003398492F